MINITLKFIYIIQCFMNLTFLKIGPKRSTVSSPCHPIHRMLLLVSDNNDNGRLR